VKIETVTVLLLDKKNVKPPSMFNSVGLTSMLHHCFTLSLVDTHFDHTIHYLLVHPEKHVKKIFLCE